MKILQIPYIFQRSDYGQKSCTILSRANLMTRGDKKKVHSNLTAVAMAAVETTERRFRVFRVLFYLTGNPMLSVSTARAYRAYSGIIMTCVSITSLTMTLEPLMNMADLEHCMQSARVIIPMYICLWIHILR